MKKYSITSPDSLVKKVDVIAANQRRSRSFIITEAIAEYLQNNHSPKSETTTQKPMKKAGAR
jgi:predicted transcriptional regulator